MARLLVFVETRGERITRPSLEALSRCREIAGASVAAAVASDAPHACLEALARYGADEAFVVTNPLFAPQGEIPQGAPLTAALVRIAEHAAPDVLVLPSGETVREILGALAVRMAAPALPDVSRFDVCEGGVEATRPVFTAGFMAHVRAEGAPVLVSLRGGSYAPLEHPARTPLRIQDVPFAFDEKRCGKTIHKVVSATSGGVDLSEAAVVVAAGRGVRDEQGKRLIEELAALLGAAVGASRGAIEAGLFPASSLIGQTGKTVSPDAYIAVGISGALQHVAGMAGSRTVIAVNKDPDAPVFRHATYGIAGDLYEILPAWIQALKNNAGLSSAANA